MGDIVKYYGLDLEILARYADGHIEGILDGKTRIKTQLFNSPDYTECRARLCLKTNSHSPGKFGCTRTKGAKSADPGFSQKGMPAAIKGVKYRADLKPAMPFSEKKSRTQIERFRVFGDK